MTSSLLSSSDNIVPCLPKFDVVYENADLVVINKPYDVAMDGGDHTVTVERWAFAYRFGSSELPDTKKQNAKKVVKFVHQLDYATSGLLCVAFSREMAARLAHCFEMRTTRKAYLAVLRGTLSSPPKSSLCASSSSSSPGFRLVSLCDVPDVAFVRRCLEGHVGGRPVGDGQRLVELQYPVGHDTSDPNGFRMAVDGKDARPCLTYCAILRHGRAGTTPVTKVLLVPHTGRRHQLRVHCRAIGFPILGDVTYDTAEGSDQYSRMMLHAWRISFPLSVEPLRCEAERVAQKKRRRRETLGLSEEEGKNQVQWTDFETEDPFQSAELEWDD